MVANDDEMARALRAAIPPTVSGLRDLEVSTDFLDKELFDFPMARHRRYFPRLSVCVNRMAAALT